MKKICYFFACMAILCLLNGCSSKQITHEYALINYTGKDVTIMRDYERTIHDGGHHFIGGASVNEDYSRADVDAVFRSCWTPLYLVYDGVKYQVDEEQKDGCAWGDAYDEPTEEEYAMISPQKKANYHLHVFRLTEDYILRQIPVEAK